MNRSGGTWPPATTFKPRRRGGEPNETLSRDMVNRQTPQARG